MAPHRCELGTPILACASLHALARRFQRGLNVSHAAVLADLAAAPEFDDTREVRTQHGRWIGLVVSLRAGERVEKAVVARTFIGDS